LREAVEAPHVVLFEAAGVLLAVVDREVASVVEAVDSVEVVEVGLAEVDEEHREVGAGADSVAGDDRPALRVDIFRRLREWGTAFMIKWGSSKAESHMYYDTNTDAACHHVQNKIDFFKDIPHTGQGNTLLC